MMKWTKILAVTLSAAIPLSSGSLTSVAFAQAGERKVDYYQVYSPFDPTNPKGFVEVTQENAERLKTKLGNPSGTRKVDTVALNIPAIPGAGSTRRTGGTWNIADIMTLMGGRPARTASGPGKKGTTTSSPEYSLLPTDDDDVPPGFHRNADGSISPDEPASSTKKNPMSDSEFYAFLVDQMGMDPEEALYWTEATSHAVKTASEIAKEAAQKAWDDFNALMDMGFGQEEALDMALQMAVGPSPDKDMPTSQNKGDKDMPKQEGKTGDDKKSTSTTDDIMNKILKSVGLLKMLEKPKTAETSIDCVVYPTGEKVSLSRPAQQTQSNNNNYNPYMYGNPYGGFGGSGDPTDQIYQQIAQLQALRQNNQSQPDETAWTGPNGGRYTRMSNGQCVPTGEHKDSTGSYTDYYQTTGQWTRKYDSSTGITLTRNVGDSEAQAKIESMDAKHSPIQGQELGYANVEALITTDPYLSLTKDSQVLRGPGASFPYDPTLLGLNMTAAPTANLFKYEPTSKKLIPIGFHQVGETWIQYDNNGNKIATIDADGNMTATGYTKPTLILKSPTLQLGNGQTAHAKSLVLDASTGLYYDPNLPGNAPRVLYDRSISAQDGSELFIPKQAMNNKNQPMLLPGTEIPVAYVDGTGNLFVQSKNSGLVPGKVTNPDNPSGQKLVISDLSKVEYTDPGSGNHYIQQDGNVVFYFGHKQLDANNSADVVVDGLGNPIIQTLQATLPDGTHATLSRIDDTHFKTSDGNTYYVSGLKNNGGSPQYKQIGGTLQQNGQTVQLNPATGKAVGFTQGNSSVFYDANGLFPVRMVINGQERPVGSQVVGSRGTFNLTAPYKDTQGGIPMLQSYGILDQGNGTPVFPPIKRYQLTQAPSVSSTSNGQRVRTFQITDNITGAVMNYTYDMRGHYVNLSCSGGDGDCPQGLVSQDIAFGLN